MPVDDRPASPRGRTSSFRHDGSTLIVEERGAGPHTLLLVHGIGMGRRVFDDLVERVGPGIRTVVVDLPGYGDSPEPARTPSIERMADTVAALIRERLRGDVTVLGHSMGSQVAVEVAARHPRLVDRVVLVAPTVNPRERTAARQLLRLAQDLAVESPRVLLRGGREYLRAGPNLRRKMRAMLAHRPELAFPRVAAPTLVLRGEQDYVSPRVWCAQVADDIPDARLVEIPGHGHETMIRDAAPAARLIREFVRGRP
ncbi:MAG: alpha/beta hydrolase [Microbacterium sp.]